MLKEISLYNGTVKLKFDDEKHRFWDDKGNPLISVTSATGVIDKSAVLMGWVAKMMGFYLLAEKEKGNDKITEELVDKAKKEYRRIKEEAADIGTEIHNWVSQWILGKNPEIPDNESVANGITAFLKFQKEYKVKWLLSERVVYSKKHGYAGILDGVSLNNLSWLSLDDFKSSKGIYDEMRFQVSGYFIAMVEEIEFLLEQKTIKDKRDKALVDAYKKFGGFKQRRILKFGKKTGDFEVRQLDETKKDNKAFLSCLNLKRRLKEVSTFNGNGF